MTTLAVSPKVHATLGASSADRWMHCGASIRLSADIPGTGETEFSREGTAAHSVLERALAANTDAAPYVETTAENGIFVTEEMCEAVQVCLDYVRQIRAEFPDCTFFIERQFNLAGLQPPIGPDGLPADMFGTSDIVIFSAKARRLWIIDYKHGRGYAVRGVDNPQLKYYGLGGLLAIESEIGTGLISDITLMIVQPRAPHPDGIIRGETLSYVALASFGDDLMEAANRAINNPGEPVAGPWCRWCRAAAVCPAQHALAQETAQIDFMEPGKAPPNPATLPLETLIVAYSRRKEVENFFNQIGRLLADRLKVGLPTPGLKLVAKRALRKWVDDEDLISTRLRELQISRSDSHVEKLKSPAQIEKIAGKKLFETRMSDLVTKESSGTVLAVEHDPRPAVTGADLEFDVEG